MLEENLASDKCILLNVSKTYTHLGMDASLLLATKLQKTFE